MCFRICRVFAIWRKRCEGETRTADSRRYEGRADERVTSTEANEVVKDVGKTDRKPAQQKQAVDGKDKKLSIHERLEINKKIIQEKQGKDKPERGLIGV